jgi:leucyl-tRNA synthetase
VRVLAPFAPHIAEGLLIEAGYEDGPDLVGAWPENASIQLPGAPAEA